MYHLRVVVIVMVSVSSCAPSTKDLIDAVEAGDTSRTRQLLQGGLDAYVAPDVVGLTALLLASSGGHTEIVELLLEEGVDVNALHVIKPEEDGPPFDATALMAAAMQGRAKVTRLLLEVGAEPNTGDSQSGKTALMYAARSGSPETVRSLIAAGADVNASDRSGHTPLMYVAGANRDHSVADSLAGADIEIIQVILENGADINAVDMEGRTASILAAMRPPFRIFLTLTQSMSSEQLSTESQLREAWVASLEERLRLEKQTRRPGHYDGSKANPPALP